MLSIFWCLTSFYDIFLTAAVVCGLLLTFGVVSDSLIVYKTVWETTLGKASILLAYAFLTNIAFALASSKVNEIVGFETSGLIYTTNFVVVLLIPFFILASTYMIFAFVFIFVQIYLIIVLYAEQLRTSKCLAVVLPKTFEKYPGASFIVRIIAFPLVIGFLWGTGQQLVPLYSMFIRKAASSFIFHLEASPYSRCKIPKGSRAIKVNDDEIIVVQKAGEGFVFKPQLCVPVLEHNAAVERDTPKVIPLSP